jgi:flagellin-like protein
MCMLKFRENEEAVSPVIGVILMVAITVILAAVIAAFVFGMSGDIETQKQVAVSAKQIADNKLQVTVQSGADLSSLQYLRIEVTPSEGGAVTFYTDSTKDLIELGGDSEIPDNHSVPISVGSTYTASDGPLTDGSDHVVIVGHFADGKQQMLLETTL